MVQITNADPIPIKTFITDIIFGFQRSLQFFFLSRTLGMKCYVE
jgi:hypothetical protein